MRLARTSSFGGSCCTSCPTASIASAITAARQGRPRPKPRTRARLVRLVRQRSGGSPRPSTPAARCMPGPAAVPRMRRPHAPHRPSPCVADRPVPMRHLMTAIARPASDLSRLTNRLRRWRSRRPAFPRQPFRRRRSRAPPNRRRRRPTRATPRSPPLDRAAHCRRRLRASPERQWPNRSRAFPIAPNRPAPSFNPAYVRSPSATPNPRAGDLT